MISRRKFLSLGAVITALGFTGAWDAQAQEPQGRRAQLTTSEFVGLLTSTPSDTPSVAPSSGTVTTLGSGPIRIAQRRPPGGPPPGYAPTTPINP
jgi:hypothetical protein